MEYKANQTVTKSNDFLKQWQERKKANEVESIAFAKTLEFQEIKTRLRKKNEARGIIIPKKNEYDLSPSGAICW